MPKYLLLLGLYSPIFAIIAFITAGLTAFYKQIIFYQ